MKKLIQILLLTMPVHLLMACSEDNDPEAKLPDEFVVASEGLFPEAFAYDSGEQVFFIGSVRKGKVIKMDRNGNITDFAVNESLKSILGVLLDEDNDRLIVCNTDPGFSEKTIVTEGALPSIANVVVFDTKTGNEIANYDLSTLTPAGSPHIANDITMDDDGNLYITDSLTPAVYKITSTGEMSIFLINPDWAPGPGSFGLNGIEYHQDGYLLLAQYGQGALFKVPLDNPSEFTRISFDTEIHSIDGVKLINDKEVLIVSNVLDPTSGQVNKAYSIRSDDDWKTGKVNGEIDFGMGVEFPTTIGFVENKPYVVYSHLTELMTGTNPNPQQFELIRLVFE